jgi:SAM-dependent methyltransferase
VLFRVQVENRLGLEIGGPSGIFADSGALPIYRYVASLDNCVFAGETLWEGVRAEGQTYTYHRRKAKGFNFIREATDLRGITDHAYDFVLSSHNLEHIANPVKALKEWIRVLKPGGALILILPDYHCTFDRGRRPTTVQHMQEDYARGVEETDQTHVAEILELHDFSRDPGAGTPESFRERSSRNFENRCLHHHVFDERNSRELLQSVGLSVQFLTLTKPHHIVSLSLVATGAGSIGAGGHSREASVGQGAGCATQPMAKNRRSK